MEDKLRKQLEHRSYRILQNMTKSMNLPSNYKKIYLIQLIIARRFGYEGKVNEIIKKVKNERMQTRKVQRSIVQIIESNSTFPTTSPPIGATPKRTTRVIIRRTPDNNKSLLKYNTRRNLLAKFNEKESPEEANRFLRSSKTIKHYSSNSVPVGTTPKETVSLVGCERIPKLNLTAKCIVKCSSTTAVVRMKDNVEILLNKENISQKSPPVKRQRTVSGIYPIIPKQQIKIKTNDVSLRRKDGTISKMNAIVQKRQIPKTVNSDLIEDILKDLDKNTSVENSDKNIIQYPKPNLSVDSAFSDANSSTVSTDTVIDNSFKENDFDYSIYYERSVMEQMKFQKLSETRNCLPKITDVFNRFATQDYTQPLHVQVNNEAQPFPLNPIYAPRANQNTLIMLESLYNFKSSHLTTTPVLHVATTSNTVCTYCTSTVATAKVHPTSTVMSHYAYPLYEQGGLYRNEMDQRYIDYLRRSESESQQDYSEDFNNSMSSVESNLDIGATVTIPEMVEDAMEIISQDGDYMERIEMEVNVNCFLCAWAGPAVVMPCHIYEEHENEIHKQIKSEWNITYTLGGLVREPLWVSKVIVYDSVLYILSAKYEDPDCFMATLSTLSSDMIPKTGSITIYNKVSGEPYSWVGDVESLPPDLPYNNNLNCLKLNLSKLNLLPNSANLKLVNRELVTDSPTKVVVGQPELNDIHIILFVKLLN